MPITRTFVTTVAATFVLAGAIGAVGATTVHSSGAGVQETSVAQYTDAGGYVFVQDQYDPATNTTTAVVTVPQGGQFLELFFSNTQRTPASSN